MGKGYHFGGHLEIPLIILLVTILGGVHTQGITRKAKLVSFDDLGPDGTSYQERIRREEGARLVRFPVSLINRCK